MNDATNIDHSAAGHACAHCDSSEDHHALDEKGIVDAFRRTLTTAATVKVLLAIALTVSAALWAPIAILAGLAGWLLATAVGLAAISTLGRKYGSGGAVILGTAGSAVVVPVAAWLSTLWLGGSPAVALAGASGWFLALTVVESLRDRRLATLLVEDSRDAEAARQGVLFGAPASPWTNLAWSLFTAALFGLWVWVIGLTALAVLPLIPLQVVLALFSRKSTR